MKKTIYNFLAKLYIVTAAIYMLYIPAAPNALASDALQISSQPAHSPFTILSKDTMTSIASAYYEHHQNDANDNLTPLQEVKKSANELGLDAQNDIFTSVLEKDTISLVQVMHDDISYHISLIRPDLKHSWIISSID